MNCGVYDSNIKNTILFYIQVPENIEKESTSLKSVDINLTFIPTYGVEIKRIFTANKDVIIHKDDKASIGELYEGTSVYIVIEITENKLYDEFIDIDNLKLGIDISYYDVEINKRINMLINSSFTSANNEQFETLIYDIKSGNRPRIKPCSNVVLSTDSDVPDDMNIFSRFT